MYQEYPISAWAKGEVIVLYQYKKQEPLPQIVTSPKSAKINRKIGIGLVSFSVLTISLMLINQILPEVRYTFAKALESKKELRQENTVQKNIAQNQEMDKLPNPANQDFSLIIPKIGINVKVVANVDSQSPKEYKIALKDGVAHAKNTAFPGQEGVTYLFAHSSGYVWNPNPLDSIFYPLSKLSKGDVIYVVFKSKLYKYEVTSQSVTDAKDTSALTINSNEQKLVLQTCWPPGTNWKRLFVEASPAAFKMDASQTIQLAVPSKFN